MKLYGFPPSPNTWKVRAVAAHIGVSLPFEIVDLTKPRTPDYLKLNPSGRAPTLVDGDFVLWESTAIMQYIASQKPNSLWPDDARTRADIVRWQSWDLAHWSKDGCVPLIFQRLVKGFLNMGPPDEAAVAKGTEAFEREARLLDAHLAKQPYLVGKARHARRLLGRRAAVLHREGGAAGRALCAPARLVRTRLGAAGLEGHRAAIPCCRRGVRGDAAEQGELPVALTRTCAIWFARMSAPPACHDIRPARLQHTKPARLQRCKAKSQPTIRKRRRCRPFRLREGLAARTYVEYLSSSLAPV